jgi:hypothetical protein
MEQVLEPTSSPGTELMEESGNARRMLGIKAMVTATQGSSLTTGMAVVGLPMVDFMFTTGSGLQRNTARATTRKSSRISFTVLGVMLLTSS